MPRRPRLNLVGLPQHVVQRGNNRDACFFADDDRQCYLHWLTEGAQKFGCAIHAWVLMSNHVRLLVTPQADGCVAALMQSVGRRYVQYINRFYKRSGTLWEGRYKASVVSAEDYLLTCMRYIELNPVRAGMVTEPGKHPWSSYRWNAHGIERRFVTEHPLYLALDRDSAKRHAAWRALFRSELDDDALREIRESTRSGKPMGGERFIKQIELMIGKRLGAAKRGRLENELCNHPLPGQLGLGF